MSSQSTALFPSRRNTGIDVIGEAPWGTHFCQFYASKDDLTRTLVPYFKAGLEQGDFCMWVTSPPLGVDEAWTALSSEMPDLESYRRTGRIEIVPHTDWYLLGGNFDQERVLTGWVRKLEAALERGCGGLRLTGNTFWLEKSEWRKFADYEAAVDGVIGQYRMLALCTYSLDRCGAAEVADVIKNHQFALIKRDGRWELFESFDRRRMQDALAIQRERLAVTLHSIGDAVIATDTEGRVATLNRVAEELTGWSELQATGKQLGEVFRIVNEKTGESAADPVSQVLARGAVVGLENHTGLIARDGKRISIADSAAPIRGRSGELLGVVLVFRDVTQARQVEQEREITIDFLRMLNEATDMHKLVGAAAQFFQDRSGCQAVGVRLQEGDDFPYCESCGFSDRFLLAEGALCIRGVDGQIVRDSTGAPRLSCKCGNVINGRFDRSDPRFTSTGTFWTSRRSNLLATSDDAQSQARMRQGCSAEGYQSMALLPLRSGPERLGLLQICDAREGRFTADNIGLWERLTGYLSMAIATRKAQQALHLANAQLINADRRKNDFLAILSHELRNPLAPIKNSLYILDRSSPGGENARRATAVIARQVEQLNRLVDDLLDVTRVSRNKIVLKREHLNLNQLVCKTVEDQRSLFERKDVRIDVELPSQALCVNGDAARLAQVISNLLQNAAKFTGPGGSTRLVLAADEQTRRAVIRVKDTGVGLKAETLALLFQPFMQAEASLDRSKGGLGLGLALVKSLVALHGGEVSAHSEGLGKGAEFVVRLPLDGAAPSSCEYGRPRVAAGGRRVLIIEDNVDAADSLREVLELGAHEVIVAYNGPDGLAKAREYQPDAVLCDIGLPGMDGYEVARALRADKTLSGMLLVAVSGYALPDDLRRAAAAGFEKHLAKPPSLEKLEELLRSPEK